MSTNPYDYASAQKVVTTPLTETRPPRGEGRPGRRLQKPATTSEHPDVVNSAAVEEVVRTLLTVGNAKVRRLAAPHGVKPAPFCCQPVRRSVLFAGPGSG